VVPFKMIRLHRERGFSLGDGDCLSLNYDGQDVTQSRQFQKLRVVLYLQMSQPLGINDNRIHHQ
jgi:hypothetical protein